TRQAEVEQWLRDAADAVNHNPTGLEKAPHSTSTNLSSDRYIDTVAANEESGRTEVSGNIGETRAPSPPPSSRDKQPPDRLRVTPEQLIELAPRLQPYVIAGPDPSWAAIVAAADWLRGELGISNHLWHKACAAMGETYAAVALALVST